MIEANAKTFQKEVLDHDGTVLLVLSTAWCSPCKILSKTIQENEDKLNAKVVKVDVDESPEIAGKYGIKSVPTLILSKAGEMVHKEIGNLSLDKLQSFVAMAAQL